ncbi:MAG: hypothetical protein JWO78_364 [Micavibrio sp.]|nr:hypothetical protein [Micavibrio sp.]
MTKKKGEKLNTGYRLRNSVAAVALTGMVSLMTANLVLAQGAPDPALAPVTSAPAIAPTNPVTAPLNPAQDGAPQATANVTPVGTPTPPNAAPAQPGAGPDAAAAAPGVDDTILLATADAKRRVRDGSVMADDNFPTLFFTAWQHALLQEAKIGFIGSRTGGGNSNAEQAKKDPGIREVSLGGIAFANAAKWTVWLNGVRVTPSAFPQQVLDIKVTQNYIDLKWFDNYTNKIYPIRLRPQERFNLDTRIFLPGAGVDKGAM